MINSCANAAAGQWNPLIGEMNLTRSATFPFIWVFPGVCGVNLSQLYCRPLSARKSHYIPYFNGGEAPQSQELLQGQAHRDE